MIIKPFHGFLPLPVLPAAQVQATSYEQHLAYIEWYLDYLAGQLQNVETLDNKVTVINADSTDEQYPSAKAVYTAQHSLAQIIALIQSQISDIPVVVANPTLAGTEADLTGLQVGDTKYAIPAGGSYTPNLVSAYGMGAEPASDDVDIPLFARYTIGDKLAVSGSKIVIGAGVSHVKISAQASLFYTSSAAATGGIQIKKNSINCAVGQEYIPVGSSAVLDIGIPGTVVAVTEGDEITCHLVNLKTGFTSMNAVPDVVVEVID